MCQACVTTRMRDGRLFVRPAGFSTPRKKTEPQWGALSMHPNFRLKSLLLAHIIYYSKGGTQPSIRCFTYSNRSCGRRFRRNFNKDLIFPSGVNLKEITWLIKISDHLASWIRKEAIVPFTAPTSISSSSATAHVVDTAPATPLVPAQAPNHRVRRPSAGTRRFRTLGFALPPFALLPQ